MTGEFFLAIKIFKNNLDYRQIMRYIYSWEQYLKFSADRKMKNRYAPSSQERAKF